MPKEVLPHVARTGLGTSALVDEPGKIILVNLAPTMEHEMGVRHLADSSPRLRSFRELVVVQNGDGIGVLGQYPSDDQTGHAGSDDYRVPVGG
jgi:hypothetical protein